MAEEVRRVKELYDKTAWFYESRYRWLQEEKYEVISGLAPIQPGHYVLDLGCGTGMLVEKLVSRGVNYVVGLDVSRNMLKVGLVIARENYTADLIQGDARWLPFKKKCFDVVYSVTVLQNIPDQDIGKVLSEVLRVLKKKGKTVFSVLRRFRSKAEELVVHALKRNVKARFVDTGGTEDVFILVIA